MLSRLIDPSTRLELAGALPEGRSAATLEQIRSGAPGTYLGLGDAGQDAQLIKQYLELLGFPSSAGDQIDPPADLAIRNFQGANNLTGSGLVDARTLEVLEALVAALVLSSISNGGAEPLGPAISPLAPLESTAPLLPSSGAQAEALRMIGEASPVVAPTARGPEAGGLYINPATGRPTAAGLPPELLQALEELRRSPEGVLENGGPGEGVTPGSSGHPLLSGAALSALRARNSATGPFTSAPKEVRLLSAKGEELRRSGPMAKLREALPSGKKPQLLGPNERPLTSPKPRSTPVKLVDGHERPLTKPSALTKLREALPGGLSPGPELLASDGKPLASRPQRPSEPTPALLDQHQEPLVGPKRMPKAPLLDQHEHPLRKTGAKGTPLQLVQANGQPLSGPSGTPPAIAAPPVPPGPNAAPRAIGEPGVVRRMDQLYLDAANASLRETGSPVQLKPGETLRGHFEAGRITGGQLKAAEAAFEHENALAQGGRTPTERFNAGEINGVQLRQERLTMDARHTAVTQAGVDAPAAPAPRGGGGTGVASKVATAVDGTMSIAQGALKADMSPAVAQALHIGGKGLFVVGAALDAATLGGSLKEDLDRGDGHLKKTVQTGAEIAGGWLGAAAAGAGAGCLAGTVFPGLGNIAGAVIGFAAGAGGYFLGHDVVGRAVGGELSKLV